MTARRTAFAARTVIGAACLGAATEVALVGLALLDPPRIPDSAELLLVRGPMAWHGTERRSMTVRWVNVETAGPLVNPQADSGSVPAWAEPPAPADARLVRHAALGIGWPWPAMACSWRTDRGDVNFPPPVETETSGDAPKEAARRMLAAIVGEAPPAGGHGTVAVLPGGLLLGSLALALPWLAAMAAVAHVRARRPVTPQG